MAVIINAQEEMTRGDDQNLVFDIIDDAGLPLDITGADVRWALSAKQDLTLTTPTSPAPQGPILLSKDNLGGGGAAVTNGPLGEVTITLAQVDTATLPTKVYFYELEIILTANKSTVAIGTLLIKKDLVP